MSTFSNPSSFLLGGSKGKWIVRAFSNMTESDSKFEFDWKIILATSLNSTELSEMDVIRGDTWKTISWVLSDFSVLIVELLMVI